MNEEEKKLPEELETSGKEPADPFEQQVPDTDAVGSEKDIVPEQGLDLDNYDKTAPFVKGERVADTMTGLPIDYDLTPEEVTKALKYFQKKTIRKKNIIYTVILGIIAVFYGQAVITDHTYALGYILGILALTVIGFMWYLPAKHIKSVARAMVLSKDVYHLEVCPDGLLLPQKDGKFLLEFANAGVSATEFSDLFLLIVSREKMFAIPKRCLSPETEEQLREMLRNSLGGRYETPEETEKPERSGKED